MRYIEDLRDLYKNKKSDVYDKDIWVIGCSPWLKDYPSDWFDDKISIRLNFSMVAFPIRTDYHYAHWYHSTWTKNMETGKRRPSGLRQYVDENVPEIYDRVILLVPHEFIRTPEDWGEGYEKIIWMRFCESPGGQKDIREVVRKILMYKVECAYREMNTVAHTAIQAALVMGAKRVILAGCECKTTADIADAQIRGMGDYYNDMGPKADKSKCWYKDGSWKSKDKLEGFTTILPIEEQRGTSPRRMRHKYGTRWIAKEASLHGREIVRHSYKKGYEPVL